MKKIWAVVMWGVVSGLIFHSLYTSTAQAGQDQTGPGMMGNPGTAWGTGSFESNGERIYFTATSDRETRITYTGGPESNAWMMMDGRLSCVSCHGPLGQGGRHTMGMMQAMDAKDIRWSALESEFDAKKFKLAVVKGQDPDGSQLNPDMPRWDINDADLSDLITFLKTLR